jgi:catechol 2,3-dioxygenase-like lactoylglutathione lyase family enzyme
MAEFRSPALKKTKNVKHVAPGPFKPSGILHFTISVSDIERSRKFYEEIVGCTYWRQNEKTIFMCCGNQFFVLSNIGYHRPPNDPGHTLIHNAFIVNGEDFDRAIAQLESKGVEILRYEDDRHIAFVGRHAYFQDPDGNAIELIDVFDIGSGDPPPLAG